jgi:ABC-2 type transport system permease protein
MMSDFTAVLWKERREHILQYGSVRRWLFNMFIQVGVIGIALPLQFGRITIESLFVLYFMWMPLLGLIMLIADSLAGERERHTLETLLASRLPDRAIFFGKIAMIVAQSWGVMLASAVSALVVVNLFKRDGPDLIMYPAPIAFGILILPPLLGILAASAGVLASMRAATVRAAEVRIVIAVTVVITIPSMLLSLLPQEIVASAFSPDFTRNHVANLILAAIVLLAILDVVVIYAGLLRFRRSNLVIG